jgi:hypothetical protein
MSEVLRPPEDVARAEEDGVWYVARVPQGPINVLRGSAAVIWEEAVNHERAGLPGRVASRVNSSVAEVRQDVEAFVAELIQIGLLEVVSHSDPAQPR